MAVFSYPLEELVVLGGIIAQTAGVLGMFSVIWLVQLIVYPSFTEIHPERWMEFHQRHCRRMGMIVGPLMCGELFGAIALVSTLGANVFSVTLLITSILTWVTTAVIFVPLHRELGAGYQASMVRSLVRRNWMRTFLWSSAAIVWTARLVYYKS